MVVRFARGVREGESEQRGIFILAGMACAEATSLLLRQDPSTSLHWQVGSAQSRESSADYVTRASEDRVVAARLLATRTTSLTVVLPESLPGSLEVATQNSSEHSPSTTRHDNSYILDVLSTHTHAIIQDGPPRRQHHGGP